MLIANQIKIAHSAHARRGLWLTKRSQFALDLFVLIISFGLAYSLRFDFAVPRDVMDDALWQLCLMVLAQFSALVLSGVYTFIWRYVGLAEAKTFAVALVSAAIPILLLRILLPESWGVVRVPLSVCFMDTVLAYGGVLGLRVSRRAFYERFERRQKRQGGGATRKQRKAVLLIGAGRAGVLAAKEIQNRGDMNLEIKGFVDDDPAKQWSVIHGVKVLGTTEDLPRLAAELNIDHVVISIAQASRQTFRRILNTCERIPVKVRVIPSLYEILQGRVEFSRIRNVAIEDLLGRETVRLDEDEMRAFLTGRTVMVTGAGGSIGAELARQVSRFQPSRLLLVERAEFALFSIDYELREAWPQLNIVALVADVGDEWRMRGIFGTYRPEVILHAAAHKHVPMMEMNAGEAAKNNVLATNVLGELAGQHGARAFVLISTDKAVCPTSVMGATKRVAELVIQNLNQKYATRYLAVRFGNVIGSAGSVIPIFRAQIKKGGPVTVTHPEMVRYFMTIPEAAQLVIEAGAIGRGGEIFILDMGEPVRILDLAKDTITLSGLRPFDDIDIVFTGMRAGEKLFEELQTTEEQITRTCHPKIFIGKIAGYTDEEVNHALKQIQMLTGAEQDHELRCFLNQLLPEAQLDTSNKNLSPVALAAQAAAAATLGAHSPLYSRGTASAAGD